LPAQLSSGYDGLLGKILLDNDEEKMKLVDKTEELMFAACASNDFRVAYFLVRPTQTTRTPPPPH
jgi:hypothetical protein